MAGHPVAGGGDAGNMVEAGLMKWNRIKAELLEIYQIVTPNKIVTSSGI